jgi:pyruvate formate lyase activating enzyme
MVEESLRCDACHDTGRAASKVLYCHRIDAHTGTHVKCQLCPKGCVISEGHRGDCRVRENRGGKLYTMVYGNPCAVHVDPIEKKPFYHYYPTAAAFSIATAGCNLHCLYCFPGEVPVLTDRGVMELQEIFDSGNAIPDAGGGEISHPQGLRVVGADGKWHPVRAAFRHQYTGMVTVVKPYYLPELRCTPDHRFLVTKDPAAGHIEVMEARELSVEHFLIVPKLAVPSETTHIDVSTVLQEYQGTYRVPHELQPEHVDFIMESLAQGATSRQVGEALGKHPSYVRGVASKVRRGLWTESRPTKVLVEDGRVRLSNERRPGIPAHLPLDARMARLLGYFCAEGCVTRAQGRPNARTLYFSFGHGEKELAEEIIALLDQTLGVKARLDRTRTTYRVGVGKTSAALLLALLGGADSGSKRIPFPILTAPSEIKQAFLDAYIQGNGHLYETGKISVTTISRTLAYELAYLLLCQGVLPSVYCNALPEERTIEGRSTNYATEQFTVVWYPEPTVPRNYHEDAERFYIPIRSVEEQPFDGPVYNLEVEKEHSYLAGLVAVKNCQNWTISQVPPEETENADMPPETVVALAKRTQSPIIAYTYAEPTVFYEYMLDTAKLGREAGIKSVVVSAGYYNPEPIKRLCEAVDAIKIDLKGFNRDFYRKVCFATLEPVLETIKTIHESGIHLEIVNLVVPTLNDDDDELRELARWIVDNVGPDVPVHYSRFFPQYKLTHLPPTPVEKLERARQIALDAGIRYAYIGNVPGHPGDNTYCHNCGEMIIQRQGFAVVAYRIKDGKCQYCGTAIPGVWWSSSEAMNLGRFQGFGGRAEY